MILALDLGTRCGWALFRNGERFASGVWRLDEDRRCSRCQLLRERVLSVVGVYKVRCVVFEQARGQRGRRAVLVFGGWLAVLEEVEARTGVELVEVSTEKMRAASGAELDRSRSPKSASKAERERATAERREKNKAAMVAAARSRGWLVADDNEAEACFVGLAAVTEGTGT